jgi:hypothetical protein
MILAGTETVNIIRRTASGVDNYGNPTHTTQTIAVANCLVAFGGSDSPQDAARDALDASATLYLPPATTVADGDIFQIRGNPWEKDGDAREFQTLNGFEVGVIVNVRRRRA